MWLPQGYPDRVEIEGTTVPVRTGFCSGIALERQAKVVDRNQLSVMLCLLYDIKENLTLPEVVLKHPQNALTMGIEWHLDAWRCMEYGEAKYTHRGAESASGAKPKFDFDADEAIMLCDFRRFYNLSLADPGTHLHWYEFVSLLMGLMHTDGSLINRAMTARSPLQGKHTQDARKAHAAEARAWALPLTEDEYNKRLLARF